MSMQRFQNRNNLVRQKINQTDNKKSMEISIIPENNKTMKLT